MSSSNSASLLMDPRFCRFVASTPPGAKPTVRIPEPKPAGPDLDALKKEAYTAGLLQGRRETATLRQEQERRWAQTVQTLSTWQDNVERSLTAQTLDLALRMAEVVVRHSLPDSAMIRSVLQGVFERITDAKGVSLRVHPDEAAALNEALKQPDLAAMAGRVTAVTDPSLAPGDVMVENGFGCFDARLEQRFDLLRQQLSEHYRKTHENGPSV